jgi:hypothetical protein
MDIAMKLKALWITGFFISAVTVSAETTSDPMARDENISAAYIEVSVEIHASGNYHYIYNVRSPKENTGTITTLSLDISCNEVPDPRGFDPDDFPAPSRRNFSEDSHHLPVAASATRGEGFALGVGAANTVAWGINLKPGSSSQGLQLLTPYPPGPRRYSLIPSIRENEERWDYSGIEEDDPDVPWIDDWTVHGITTGPACPGEEYEDGDDGEDHDARFPGSVHRGEQAALNHLLTYSAPLRDQFYLEDGSREVEMIIHYHPDIDPKSFRVTPERHGLRARFNPRPGTAETVRLPLDTGKNQITLQVKSARDLPESVKQRAAMSPPRRSDAHDRDVFVIRVPANDDKPGKGKGRKSGQQP